jgi:AraC-like DNA-binding protein
MATRLMPRDVQQALTLLNADPAGEHTVGKLALACGVAARTLQQHFRQFLGQSPIEALRGIRLDLVRRKLLMGRDDTEITELATRGPMLPRFALSSTRRESCRLLLSCAGDFRGSPTTPRRGNALEVLPGGCRCQPVR